jgi:GT2 family glycosyltransferase/SAM-dependent methyltransferase/glycosyltransferase involved in cell wall biosynthesis
MSLKVAHVVNYAPGLSGMYGSVRDLMLEERRQGADAGIIDSINSPIVHGTDGVYPVPLSFADEADILCWHHAFDDNWLNEPHRNIVLFLHGTPEFNYATEVSGQDRPLSLLIGAANQKIPRAFVTMWKRHVPFWEHMLRTKVHLIPAWVNLDEWQVSQRKPEKDVIRIGMMDFGRLTREPFGLIHALEQLRRNTKKKVIVNVWGLYDAPDRTLQAVLQWLVQEDVMFLRGRSKDPQKDIFDQNDMILTMSTEETRVVREAYSCGVPVVCGRGPLAFTNYSADCLNPSSLADTIERCHQDLTRNNSKIRDKLRAYAKTNFDVQLATAAILEVFEDVVKEHGSVSHPKLTNGVHMVERVQVTADKVKQRLLRREPVCYLRFGDGDLILIAGAEGEKFHKNSPELQKELTEAFCHKEDGYLVSSVAGMMNEGRMRQGLFARFEYDSSLVEIVNQLRPGETLDNAIALAYMSVFQPEWFVDFVRTCIHGRKVLFIGGEQLCQSHLIKRVFDVKTLVSFPMANAYYGLENKMDEIRQLAKEHDLIICAAGMATRVIAKKLWTEGIKTSFIDIGSIADGIAGISDTRTWLRMVGEDYRKNFELAFSPAMTDIIVLSYGQEEKTIRCFEAIQQNATNYRVIWVDNGSGEASIEKVKPTASKFQDCDLITLSANEGFSRGVNRALRKTLFEQRAEYVLLLNNDVVVTKGFLEGLVAAQVTFGLDALGPLTSENNPHSLDALRGVESTLPVFTNESIDERAKKLREQYGSRCFEATNMLSFFCCLMPRATIEKIGLLDEGIFAYGEDNDYFERMRRLGMKFGIALGAYVHHDHGATTKTMGEGWKEKRQEEAKKYLAKKWGTISREPGKAADLERDKVPANQEKYIKAQTEKYCSHETGNPLWEEGQRRFIDAYFVGVPRDAAILDLGCGDGVGLRAFKDMGFENVIGVDVCQEKLKKAEILGYKVINQDFHDLEQFMAEEFDIIYSSHSLEHALDPENVLFGIARILRRGGKLILALPFPDAGPLEAHCGKVKLGTDKDDGGNTVVSVVERNGFTVVDKKTDGFREPEIWLTCVRK